MEHSDDMKDKVNKYLYIIAALYVYLGMAQRFGYITIPGHAENLRMYTYFLLCGVLCLCIYYKKFPKFRKENGNLLGLLMVGIAVFTLALASDGYLCALDATIGTQQMITIEGAIVRKLAYRSRRPISTDYSVFVSTIGSVEPLQIEVTKEQFDQLSVGAMHSSTWTRGAFGILYKKRNP